jgi:hypothetical protein
VTTGANVATGVEVDVAIDDPYHAELPHGPRPGWRPASTRLPGCRSSVLLPVVVEGRFTEVLRADEGCCPVGDDRFGVNVQGRAAVGKEVKVGAGRRHLTVERPYLIRGRPSSSRRR